MNESQRKEFEQKLKERLSIPEGFTLWFRFTKFLELVWIEVDLLNVRGAGWGSEMAVFDDFFNDHPDDAMAAAVNQIASDFESALRNARA